MYIKGEIGECVLIKAVIEKVEVTGKEEVRYGVKVLDGNSTMNYLEQSQIMFKEDYPAEEDLPEPEGGRRSLPVDDEWARPAPKKRGRPRKATVEDLINKAKGVQE